MMTIMMIIVIITAYVYIEREIHVCIYIYIHTYICKRFHAVYRRFARTATIGWMSAGDLCTYFRAFLREFVPEMLYYNILL